jgi:hypothetical protein
MSQTRAAVASEPRKAINPEVAGVVVAVEPEYPREVGIGWHIILPILLGAGVARLPGLLVATLLRNGRSSGGSRRTLKELRRGPEFLVTEFIVRGADGTLVELEIHGHLPTSALIPRDRVRAEVRRQRRNDLPPRAHRLENHTSGRVHRPHTSTMLSHLGLPLLLQAILGLAIILLVVAALVMRHT